MSVNFREAKLQSEDDIKQMTKLSEYIKSSNTNDFFKFVDCPKYVQKNVISRFLARYEIFKLLIDIPGSIVELGVARGASLMTWAQFSAMFEPVNFTREIIGFDTFQGIPCMNEKDENEWSSLLGVGKMNPGEAMYDDIKEAVEIYDTNRPLGHIEKVKLIKGNIMDTLPKYIEDNPHLTVSLLHLDTDLYDPTKLGLELLLSRMPKGAIILFDELNAKTYPGETIATMETIGINKLRLKRFPWATTIAYAIIE